MRVYEENNSKQKNWMKFFWSRDKRVMLLLLTCDVKKGGSKQTSEAFLT